ncbi:hypothetical protein [Neobacillus soli]|uniref:hypothetical protein n=1 Tax=Neobacillus soli TaxID=220688 RepID=UPI0008258650|nr:hypothetical protein [Neobacillus soli]
MRHLLMLLPIFFLTTSLAEASLSIPSKIENIDLNIKDHEAALTFFGLSTGESTLIQGQNGENILVNAGGKGTMKELEGWLFLYNVKKISTLILTNNRMEISDKQINQLILKYNIKEIIATPQLSAQLAKNLEAKSKTAVVSWGEGTKKVILPELTLVVEFVGNEQNEGMDLTLQFFMHRIFLMSSYSLRAEQRLLTKNIKDAHIFKIPSGKIEDSLSEKLIQYVNPQISFLFTAKDQHTDQNILHELYDTWSEVYFANRHGTVTIKFTDSTYEVLTIPDLGR